MRPVVRIAWLMPLIALGTLGCNGNPFASADKKNAFQKQAQQQQPYEAQIAELNRRASQLDSNNRDMHAQLAQAQQQSQVLKDQIALLQKQLGDTSRQLREVQVAKQEAEKKADALQTSVQKRGGAIITANNSVKQSLHTIDIPGLEVRQEEDVIRIELPADQLFRPGTAQLLPSAIGLVDQVADAITRNYPRQRIGIEGHTDGEPSSGGAAYSSHQLTAAQSNALLEQLIQRNHLPPNQLFAVAHGANHPRFANATPAGRARNRRIEIAVYPETIDGR